MESRMVDQSKVVVSFACWDSAECSEVAGLVTADGCTCALLPSKPLELGAGDSRETICPCLFDLFVLDFLEGIEERELPVVDRWEWPSTLAAFNASRKLTGLIFLQGDG